MSGDLGYMYKLIDGLPPFIGQQNYTVMLTYKSSKTNSMPIIKILNYVKLHIRESFFSFLLTALQAHTHWLIEYGFKAKLVILDTFFRANLLAG